MVGGVAALPWATIISVSMLLMHLAGLVVAIIILVRVKKTASIMALVSFAVLVLIDVGNMLRSYLGNVHTSPLYRWPRVGSYVWGGTNCCCAVTDVIAVVLLIVALWLAIVGPQTESDDEEAVEEMINE